MTTIAEDARQVKVRGAGRTALRAAYVLSAAVGGLMLAASSAGLFVEGLYPDDPWAREAFRAGDLVTMALVAPALITSLIMSARGSTRATLGWMGMLGYSVYNYAYFVFGARFNDIFLLHVALFSISIFALVSALRGLDVDSLGGGFRSKVVARSIGMFLLVVGLAQGGLWVFVVLRFVTTGQLLEDIPVEGQHLVFALDLSLLAPTLVLASVLLLRVRPVGFVMGTAVSVFGAAYQINLMASGVFQANADVPGVKAFPLESIILTVGFVVASVILLLAVRGARREGP